VVWASDLIETFTDIRALKVISMCQIITIYLNKNKNYGHKTVVTVEPRTGSTIVLRGC
jgi:hypothetical protein